MAQQNGPGRSSQTSRHSELGKVEGTVHTGTLTIEGGRVTSVQPDATDSGHFEPAKGTLPAVTPEMLPPQSGSK